MNQGFMYIAILLPVLAGLGIFAFPEFRGQKSIRIYTAAALALEAIIVCALAISAKSYTSVTLLNLTDDFYIAFAVDGLGRFFAPLMAIVWLLAGIFSFQYMKHEKNEARFFAFFLITLGILEGLCFSANFITFYMLYEFMTLMALPLVLHSQTEEAIRAGKKFWFYSVFGAFCSLAGIFCLNLYAPGLNFAAGGSLDYSFAGGDRTFILVAALLIIIGFSTKAGMFPLHGWLPEAHPVAPAPASAVLSGVITKTGVLGIIRAVFYVLGVDYIRGTFVQYVWIVLALITVFMGSMMAYRENLLKKRLAYSTVSQVSYILFGLALLTPQGFTGAMLHVICHSVIKDGLFLAAGAIIFYTGKTKVDELSGLGKAMPLITGAYTIVSLGLIGIPPTIGFISKWHLAAGSLDSGLGTLAYVGPIVLLISAVLTAGYLLSISVKGYLAEENPPKIAVSRLMTVPVVIFAAAALMIGMFPGGLVSYITDLAATIF